MKRYKELGSKRSTPKIWKWRPYDRYNEQIW